MTTISRGHLKAAIVQRLAEVAVEHPAGHQGKLAVRFLLRSENGEAIELMFEKGAASPANLWMHRGFAEPLMSSGIERRESMSGTLGSVTNSKGKKIYGRHAALLAMRQLANADLVCFKVRELAELEAIIEILRQQ